MPGRKSDSKLAKARRWLSGGTVTREDSDDELGYEDLPWEWIYGEPAPTESKKRKREEPESTRTIVGAKMGTFECKVGDTVFLKSADNHAWVGIIYEFGEKEEGEKSAQFMWFSSPGEIRNKAKKRTDFYKVSLQDLPAVLLNFLTSSVERTLYLTNMGLESTVFDQRHRVCRFTRDLS